MKMTPGFVTSALTTVLTLTAFPGSSEETYGLRSRPKLQFINAGPNPLEVFWLAPDGRRVPNGRIEPGEDHIIGTTLGHRFLIVDDGEETEVVSKVPVQSFRHDPYDSAKASKFEWAERLETAREAIRAAAVKRSEEENANASAVRFDPVERDVEGWKVHVDPALLDGEHREEGAKALAMLANHLQRIKILVPSGPLEKMMQLEIWIEHRHPTLKAKQYHPSRNWLVENGHDPRLVRKVHIPQAHDLLSREQLLKHPAVILHELAHAYHDQVLGFDHPEIIAAFEKAKAAGGYESVLAHTGGKVRHYALTNHKEYFAEGTEAFFYRNDFYPFVRAELKEHDPEMFDLLGKIWGVEPKP